jgi:hypothetical protein
MASFTISSFSLDAVSRATSKDLEERYRRFAAVARV